MRLIALYLLFLKATATSFAGLASVPVIRDELVVKRHMITDRELNAAVVITRSTPGPAGVYVVSVGFLAAGVLGALAGWLAMATPSLAVIGLLRFFSGRSEHQRVKSMLQAVVTASAGLLVNSALPTARDALVDPITLLIAACSAVALLRFRIDSLWVLGTGAAMSLTAWLARFGSVSQ